MTQKWIYYQIILQRPVLLLLWVLTNRETFRRLFCLWENLLHGVLPSFFCTCVYRTHPTLPFNRANPRRWSLYFRDIHVLQVSIYVLNFFVYFACFPYFCYDINAWVYVHSYRRYNRFQFLWFQRSSVWINSIPLL
jgi:hypothetical protein